MAIYLVASLVIGLVASNWLRKPQPSADAAPQQPEQPQETDSEDDYFLAGRNVPGWVNGVSYAATALNADVGPTYCGFAVVVGLPIAFFYLPRFALAWMIAALLFAVRWRQLGVCTGPEFYALRFGGQRTRFVRVYSALFAVCVNMVPWIGAGMLGVHKIFGPTFGIEAAALGLSESIGLPVDPKALTLAIVLPVLMLYVWTSGFAGVVVTDVMQTLVIVGASVMLLVAVLFEHGGPTGLAEGIQAALPNYSGEVLSTWPVWGHRVLAPMVVLAWLVVPTVGRGGSVDLEGQRLFSCRTDRDAARMNIWAVIGLFLMLLLLTLPTLGLLIKQPELYLAEPGEREKAYGLLLDEYLPVGMLGVALAALLASVMSTISSHLSYGSQTLVNDVLRQAFPGVSWLREGQRGAVWAGRGLMLVVLAMGIIVTFNADSLIGIAIVLSGMYGATATVYWGQWWWWRVNFWSWFTAMIGGPIAYWALGAALSNWPWWAEQAAAGESAAQGMAMIQAALGMGLTFVAWVAVTLFTKPESLDTLKNFYRNARPMGAWGPVRQACLTDDPDWQAPPEGLLREGLAIAVLGAAWVSSGVLGLSVLTVGRWPEAALYLALATAGGLAFKKLFDWRMRRMEATC